MKNVRVKGKPVAVRRRKMAKVFGRTYPSRQEIEIDSSLSPDSVPFLSVLTHEMLHRLNWSLSEKRVLHLEYAIVTMVLSNPEVFSRLSRHSPR